MMHQSVISEVIRSDLNAPFAPRSMFRRLVGDRLLALAILVIACVAVPPGFAQSAYPAKPIKIVLGFSAGGGTDVITRAIGRHMGESLGASVVIDNKPGANGNIAAEIVAKAPADGYTLLYNTSSIASSPALYGDKLKYDVLKDLVPIGRATSLPMVLLVPANSQFSNVGELVAYMRANPGKVDYGSGGNGNVTHLSALAFESAAGVKGAHIQGGRPGNCGPDGRTHSVLLRHIGWRDSRCGLRQSQGARSCGIIASGNTTHRPDLK